MGLLTSYLLKKTAEAVGTAAVFKIGDKLEKKHGEKAVKERLSSNNYVYVNKNAIGNRYIVLDSNNKKKYRVCKEFGSYALYSNNDNELGEVSKHKNIFTKAISFTFTLSDNEVGTMVHNGNNPFKQEYIIKSKNWIINHKSLFEIEVVCGGITIIRIHEIYDTKQKVLIEFNDNKYEKMAILIFAAFQL